MCSYVENCAELKKQTLKKSAGTQKYFVQRYTSGGSQYLKIVLKRGHPCSFVFSTL